ncbi:MAG TPA: phosphate ABC transporter ATP-binding protein [Roseiflexaceae bacterium]|nr:phosphate ABC transporter ATP-binding protein [Roseiflexaceae bacterium]
MRPPLYQLENVTKRYGDRLVLDIAELNVGAEEVLAIVGPSGAGKSTLLRLLNFLEVPTGGFIRFGGRNLARPEQAMLDLRRQVTMVFQRPLLLSTTVLNNVAYGLRVRRVARARQRAAAALAEVGLAHLANAPAQSLSGGEQQRVALARALVIEPRVLLLDEPTANLDPHNVQQIEQTIAEAQRRRAITIVLVTHNLFQARRLAGRVALLLDGRIVETAGVKHFFETPDDPRTAAFVRGEMIY